MAYLGLYEHFLGSNNIDDMATMAEDKLKSTVYNGEQRRWDYEKYVNAVHKSQHSIMEDLVEHGYTDIDPQSKVRFLMDGINDKFDSVKTRIMSDADLRNDFDACVTLYQDFIKQTSKSKSNPTVGILEIKTGGPKRKCNAIDDCYYTKVEYEALDASKKKELAIKRLKRGHKPGAKDSKVVKNKTKDSNKANDDVIKNLKAVKRSISQLSKQVKGAEEEEQSPTQSTDSASKASPKKGNTKSPNRNNAALTRQKKTK